ncbi:unnamed protein product [Adineta steineri]|uniref:Uncharacterized protein n=1 Tax=Adineta steineri TaxID=433720 RepID=A0A814NKV5_9BILA|nr:unnamed protein product [Adineta steineri]CAF1122821.1 unnamed protein product [Adineta steineri]CAF3581640.1 unnamed protein product [Adineta steineri]CAF3656799.1 unnamed protein product [Adineta steineri]
MNRSIATEEQQHLHVPSPPSNLTRSFSLKSQHSKQDYIRRKSAADAPSLAIKRLELSADNNENEQINTPPPRRPSAALFQRRFTVFSVEEQYMASNRQRRMTTGRFSFFDNKSNTNLLKNKRPSVISQVVESFVRRFSLRKKKNNNNNNNNNNDQEQDETIIDPVYETLKIAAETRKMTLANYLQQRQQILNKQTSLNSQGSSEPDIQSSPRASRHASRTENDLASSLKPSTQQPIRTSLGKRYSSVRLTSTVDKHPFSTRYMSFKNSSTKSRKNL